MSTTGDEECVPAALELGEEVVDEAVLGAHRPRAVPRVHLPAMNHRRTIKFGFKFARSNH